MSPPSPTTQRRKLAVFGATGQTGRQVVELALAHGHAVTALARNPAKLGDLAAHVNVVHGDVMDPAPVERTVRGADAVLITLGRGRGSPPDLETRASTNVIAAMTRLGIRRIIVLANSAVSDPADRPSVAQRALRLLLRISHRSVWKDTVSKAHVLERSDLDWTIVRASVLREGPATGEARIGRMSRGRRIRVSRADVAAFMLTCATSDEYIHGRPYVG